MSRWKLRTTKLLSIEWYICRISSRKDYSIIRVLKKKKNRIYRRLFINRRLCQRVHRLSNVSQFNRIAGQIHMLFDKFSNLILSKTIHHTSIVYHTCAYMYIHTTDYYIIISYKWRAVNHGMGPTDRKWNYPIISHYFKLTDRNLSSRNL